MTTPTKPVERDGKSRFPECPLAWCHYMEHCGTVGCCLYAKYDKEGAGNAPAGFQHRDDR